MGFLEGLVPLLKMAGVLALAMSLSHGALTLLARHPQLPQNAVEMVTIICEKAVMAIEQAHGNLASIDKKQLAVQMVTEILSKMGINVPASLIDAGIEAAVLALGHLSGQKAA